MNHHEIEMMFGKCRGKKASKPMWNILDTGRKGLVAVITQTRDIAEQRSEINKQPKHLSREAFSPNIKSKINI